MDKTKILIVSYWFPPKEVIASHRVYAFAKYLSEFGCQVEVVCPKWNGNLQKNCDSFQTTYTHTILTGISESKRRSIYHRVKEFVMYRIFKYNHFRDSRKGIFYKKFVELNIDLSKYDLLITSYGPTDVIHIGEFVKTQNPSIKWCLDYRDYFSLNPYHEYGWSKFYFKKLEKKLTAKCDLFCTVSETLKTNIEKLIGKKGIVIYNGFDLSDIEMLDKTNLNIVIEQPYIAYTGSLYNGKRDVLPFLNFFKKSGLDSKFKLLFCILNLEDEIYLKSCLSKSNIKNYQIVKSLPHSESLKVSQGAAYLLLLSDFDAESNGFLTGKFYEYLMFNKPILYSGRTDNYELYTLIKKYNLGESFNEFDFTNASIKYKYESSKLPFTRNNQVHLLYKKLMEII